MWTLKEASKALAVSHETLRKAIVAAELPGVRVVGHGGHSWRVEPEVAREWAARRIGGVGTVGSAVGGVATPLASVGGEIGTVGTIGALGGAGAPEEVGAGVAGGGRGAMPEATGSHAGDVAPMDALLRALELSQKLLEQSQRDRQQLQFALDERDRATRRADLLATELQSYQRILGEQAESLAEERSRRLALELATTYPQHLAEQIQQDAAGLKIATPIPSRGWGNRIKRLFGMTG